MLAKLTCARNERENFAYISNCPDLALWLIRIQIYLTRTVVCLTCFRYTNPNWSNSPKNIVQTIEYLAVQLDASTVSCSAVRNCQWNGKNMDLSHCICVTALQQESIKTTRQCRKTKERPEIVCRNPSIQQIQDNSKDDCSQGRLTNQHGAQEQK